MPYVTLGGKSKFFFFFLEFQPMMSILDDNSLLLNQDTNQFLEHELVS